MKCKYLDENGNCTGLYAGFRCIKEKCKADRSATCEFNELDFYCRKFRRFECIGINNCGTLDDYFSFLRKRRESAQRSK
jgi:hypothetical protein